MRQLLKKTSVQNFINLSLNQGTNVLVALLATPLLYQRLGEAQYGLVSLALNVVMMSAIVVNFGFNLNSPKKLALLTGKPGEKEQEVNEVLTTRLLLSMLLAGTLLVLVFVGGLFPNYGLLLVFSLIILFNEAIFPMFILQGFDRLGGISWANFATKLLYLAGLYLIVKESSDARWVNFLLGGTGLTVNLILLVLIYKAESMHFRFASISRVWTKLTGNFHYFLSTLAAFFIVNGGLIILSNFVDDEELGRFALAQKVALLLRMVPVFLTQSILQTASRLYDQSTTEFKSYLSRAYRNGLLICLAMGIAFFIAAPFVVRVLGGEHVQYSVDVLRILCFIPFVGMLNTANMIKILVADQKRIMSTAIWVTTVIMLLLAFVGSYFFGGKGLAVTLLISEFINYLIHSALLKKGELKGS